MWAFGGWGGPSFLKLNNIHARHFDAEDSACVNIFRERF